MNRKGSLQQTRRETAVVVPCYNESERLPKDEFIRFCGSNEDIHFILVDDGSTDRTLESIHILEQECGKKVAGLRLEKNSGKAEAVRRGFLKAIGEGYARIGYWDADLSTPLESIPTLCRELERKNASIVMGSRVRLLGRKIERKAIRHYLGRIFATCASLTLGVAVYDTQCGAKLFRNGPFLKEVFSHPFNVKWTFDVEILARYKLLLRKQGLRLEEMVVEFPLETWTHVSGSKVTPADFFKAFLELLRIYFYLHSPHCLHAYEPKIMEGNKGAD